MQIELVFKNFTIWAESDTTDDIINCIRRAYELHFFNYPLELRFKLSVPPSRLTELPPIGTSSKLKNLLLIKSNR
jgi:hypothetical protein